MQRHLRSTAKVSGRRHKEDVVARTTSGVDLAEIAIFSELSERELKAVARLMTELDVKEGSDADTPRRGWSRVHDYQQRHSKGRN